MASTSALVQSILREKPAMVSFVGAGGKSSLMWALARELRGRTAARGAAGNVSQIVVTVSTRLAEGEIPEDFLPLQWNGRDPVAGMIASAHEQRKIPLFFGERADGKLTGLDPQAIAALATPRRTVLVEADGARGRPLKRLREHEPVIPIGPLPAIVCIVMGLDALLKPLDEQSCFNHTDVICEGLAAEGTVLGPAVVRDILFAPARGYPKAIPEGQEAILCMNKADLMPSRQSRNALARQLFHPTLKSVFLTSVRGGFLESSEVTNADDRVLAIVPAAGKAVRFGRPKQAEPIDNTCLPGIVVRNALQSEAFERVVLVLGYESKRVRNALGALARHDKLDIVLNEDYERGMSTSLRAGIDHALSRGCDAVAFLPGDMPLLDSGLIATVLDRYRSSCSRLCYVQTNGRPGHPIVVRRDLFNEFRGITGDTGGREIIRRNLGWALGVTVDDPRAASQLDIDTVEDLKIFLSHFRRPDHS